jgi:hypothetical protein
LPFFWGNLVVEAFVAAGIIGGLGAWIAHQVTVFRAATQVHRRLQAEGAPLVLPPYSVAFTTQTLGQPETRWRYAVVALTSDGLIIYPRQRVMDEAIRLPFAALRWFGRPVKYHDGRNEIWLHYQLDERWQVVKLRLNRYSMADLVRAIKGYVAPELVTAYRRHRPYVHYGPVRVQPAEDDIYGAWTLGEPLSIYVMPSHIVLLDGERVFRLLPLEQTRQVTAMRRIDQPDADGLVTFDAIEESFSYACKDYQALAQAIAEASRRSLEHPLLQKQKGKKDYDDEYDDDE